MQLLIVFATIFAASVAFPVGEGGINNAVQTSNVEAGLLGTAISSGNALAGSDAGRGRRGVEGLGLGAMNNARQKRQTSNALAGAGGVALATGSASAGNGLVKRAGDDVIKNSTQEGEKRAPTPKVKRAVAMIVGGPNAGQFVAV